MKNYCIFELAALAALTFASCSSESVEDFLGGGNQASQQVAIGFDGYLGRSAVDTRGTVSDLPAIQTKDVGFGVFGNYTASGSDVSYGSGLFKNQHVTYKTSNNISKWEYTPVKYWPTAGHIDFLAYAPYDEQKTLSGTKFDFTVSNNVADQIDLLWANAANQTKANNSGKNKVEFTFKHALAKIGYSVTSTNNDTQTTITVKSIKLVGSADGQTNAFYTKGTIDLSKDNNDANDLWTNTDDTKQNFDWLSKDKTLSTDKYESPDYLFVIPQDFSGTTTDQLYVVVEYTVTTDGSAITNTVSKKISRKFLQGKAYMINLTIGLTPIEFNAEVSSWTDDNSENIDLNK